MTDLPGVIPRSEWGAAPPRGSLARASYPMSRLWLHHSVTNPTDDPAADARAIQSIHFGAGYGDVGYTLLAHPSGVLLQGRDLDHVGSHTYGQNGSSLAICLIGNYDTTEPPESLIEAARRGRDLLIEHGYLTPGTYPTGGHRDAPDNSTACPGRYAYARLDEFRAPSGTEEDDMAEHAEQLDRIEANVKNWGRIFHHLGDGNWEIGADRVSRAVERIEQLDGERLDPEGGSIDLDALAGRVVDKLAERLQQ